MGGAMGHVAVDWVYKQRTWAPVMEMRIRLGIVGVGVACAADAPGCQSGWVGGALAAAYVAAAAAAGDAVRRSVFVAPDAIWKWCLVSFPC